MLKTLTIKEADEIILDFCNALGSGVPHGHLVHSTDELKYGLESISLAFHVVVANLLEIAMKTNVSQSKPYNMMIGNAAHLGDFIPSADVKSISTGGADAKNRMIASRISVGMRLVGSLQAMTASIMQLDVKNEDFRDQMDNLVGVVTSRHMDGGGTVFRTEDPRPKINQPLMKMPDLLRMYLVTSLFYGVLFWVIYKIIQWSTRN